MAAWAGQRQRVPLPASGASAKRGRDRRRGSSSSPAIHPLLPLPALACKRESRGMQTYAQPPGLTASPAALGTVKRTQPPGSAAAMACGTPARAVDAQPRALSTAKTANGRRTYGTISRACNTASTSPTGTRTACVVLKREKLRRRTGGIARNAAAPSAAAAAAPSRRPAPTCVRPGAKAGPTPRAAAATPACAAASATATRPAARCSGTSRSYGRPHSSVSRPRRGVGSRAAHSAGPRDAPIQGTRPG